MSRLSRTLSLISSIFFLCCNARGVSFYRSQDSAFPSGDAPLEKLLEKVVAKDTQVQFKVSWDHHDFLVAKNDLLFDIEVSEKVITSTKTALMSAPDFSSQRLTTMPANKPAKILKSMQLWLYVEVMNESVPMQGWVHAQDIKSDEADFGFYRSFFETKLREKPDSNAKALVVVPQLSALRAMEETPQWIRVKFNGHNGYISKQYLISKIDFADTVLGKSGEWQKVLKINNDHVLVKSSGEQKSIPIKQLIKIRTDESKAFVIRAQAQEASPQAGSQVSIVEKRGEVWYQSVIEGHNRVWWTEKKEKVKTITITDQELRKKKINSISLIDTGELLGVASANGIYKTDDGQTWQRIESFQNLEYPVLAHPNGTLFVGPYRSVGKGDQFEPFIKFDELASMIKQKYNYDPRFFKMTKMEHVGSSEIKLTFDIGIKKVQVLSSVTGLQMKLAK